MSNNGSGRGFLFSRGGRGGGRGGGLLGSAVRGVAGGIGLVSESVSSYKDKRNAEKNAPPAQPAQQSQGSSSNDAPVNQLQQNTYQSSSQKGDATERQWELDDTQTELLSNPNDESSSSSSQTVQNDTDLATIFIREHGLTNPPTGQRLEMPVILAQRRPKNRSRGFVRGYAPILEDVGINQETWLDFLDKFDAASMASPWIQVLNFAEIGGFFVPFAPSIAISAAVYLTIEITKDMHSRQNTNKFLGKLNEEYFYPRGLCCLIMTWREGTGRAHEMIDLNKTIASSMSSQDSGIADKFSRSSGKTYGDFSLPEAAPLIFPTLDVLDAADTEESKGFKKSMAAKKNFVAEYYDKRAQAEFAHNNTDNVLANQGERPEFTSRYADPSHPANSGSILSLLTGGNINPNKSRSGRGGMSSGGRGGRGGRGGITERLTGKSGPVFQYSASDAMKKLLLSKDVLYMMVVNMPTEQELNEAKAALGRE
ncbi:unnamed protein product [Fusarium graminearum]|nr:hypothetical protein FG05_03367 [Fusarium graminearum]CAF3498957.1 unnamed protein product [Fusarium graminearum]SCB65804.1 unnamed protein product [Fusarium graminearum]